MPGQEEEKACRDITTDYIQRQRWAAGWGGRGGGGHSGGGEGGRQTIQLGLMLRRGRQQILSKDHLWWLSLSGVQCFCAHTDKEEKVSQGESEAGSVPTLKCQSMMEGP